MPRRSALVPRVAALLGAVALLAVAPPATGDGPPPEQTAVVRSMWLEPPAFVPASSGGIVKQWPLNRMPEPTSHPRGRFTIVWFRLNEFGIARFQVQRRLPGRPARWRAIGEPWARPGGPGPRPHSWYFSGRVGNRPLPPGTYRLAARVYDVVNSRPPGRARLGPQVTRTFRVLPQPG